MEIELLEIRDFLAQHAPFDVLPSDTLDALPRKLMVRYLRRGSRFPPVDSDNAYLYILRSGAIEVRDDEDQLREKLGEGDLYPYACQRDETPGGLSAVTTEDSLFYLLPCEELKALRECCVSFDRHFSHSLRERLEHAIGTLLGAGAQQLSALTTEVSDLVAREPITIDANSSIQAAAQLMTAQQVSSVMVVEEGRLIGLVTDSDLRRRCLAAGLSSERPVRDIMTRELKTVPPGTLLSEALLTMTRLRVHHLPVKDNATLIGMITASDLVRYQRSNPAFLASAIGKARSLTELVQLALRLPGLQLQLSRSGSTARHIGEAIASLTDAITVRLIEIAQQQLGPPPLPFVWLAGGSQGRREQTIHTDQDNALIVADAMSPEQEAYFAELTRLVCDGLDACGFVHCPGEAMASNARWRQPLDVWQGYFDGWIQRPEPKALMLSSIFFDLRPVYGEADLFERLQKHWLTTSKDNRIFIAYMVANALTHRPPLGLFRHFVLIHDGVHDDTLDTKHRGLVPIVDVARVYALSEGLPAVNTYERLQAARECGALSEEMSANLQDAFEFLASLRIRHQAEQIRTGETPDNYLAPAELSQLERKHLKDAFVVIKDIQDTLENRYQAGRLR
jgi:CBS domain-containing protein